MSTYKFRFEFIDNIRSVTSGIKAQFAQMKASAKAFADQVNANRGAAGFRKMADASAGAFNIERVRGFASELMNMNDTLFTGESLIFGITRSSEALKAARIEAKELSKITGVSVIEATSGLAKMLTLTDGNISKASDLTKIASALGNMDTEQGFAGAIYSLKELGSGSNVSLYDRFGIKVPTGTEAAAIAKRDGITMQEVMLKSLNQQLDKTYGGGQKGEGVKFLMTLDDKTIGGQLKRIKASFISAFTPIITEVGPRITSFFTGISTWVANNEEAIRRFTPPVLALVGAFAGFSVISSIVSGVTVAVSGLTVVLGVLTSPVTLVVVGIAALTAGVIYAWNHFEGFRGALMGCYSVIREVGRIIYEYVSPAFAWFKQLIIDIWPTLKWLGKGIFDFVVWPFKMVAKVVGAVFGFLKDKFKGVAKDMDMGGTMKRIGNAAREGYQKGVDAKPITLFGKKKDGQAEENPYKQLMAGGAGTTGAGGAAAGSGGGGGLSSVGGIGGEGVSGSGKDVRISINKLVETMNVYVGGGIKEGATKIKQEIERALIDAVNDFNYAN